MEDELALLLNKVGDQIVVSDKVVAAAITNKRREFIFDIFKIWKPNACAITPWIVQKVAAGTGRDGLEYLMKHSDQMLRIDEELWALAKFRDAVDEYSYEHSVAVLQTMWSEGPVADEPDVHGRTALHSAMNSNIVCVQFLLNVAGADVHAADRTGLTPLHIAISRDTLGIVLVLLAHGANPHAPDLDGRTPISAIEAIQD
ncbi:hypothetical protein VHEMI08850 [[Torrubiella] hemipterigena]|uniref:Uncharacterized protein n=1 Tax=[Torrubiella] hemipterigena TaxID=1531966 RepID=A0A0A1TNZ9_9HYPO|nr:hypothetical protein VHEMI08850 [[Torrubiella] hemipterigena]